MTRESIESLLYDIKAKLDNSYTTWDEAAILFRRSSRLLRLLAQVGPLDTGTE